MDEQELTLAGRNACAQFLAATGSLFVQEAEQTLIDKYGGHGSAGPDQHQCYAIAASGSKLSLCYYGAGKEDMHVNYLWAGMRPEARMEDFKVVVRPLEEIAARAGLNTMYVEGRDAGFYNVTPVQMQNGRHRTIVRMYCGAASPALNVAEAIRDSEGVLAEYVRARSP